MAKSLQKVCPRLLCNEILSPEAHIATIAIHPIEKESHKTKTKGLREGPKTKSNGIDLSQQAAQGKIKNNFPVEWRSIGKRNKNKKRPRKALIRFAFSHSPHGVNKAG